MFELISKEDYKILLPYFINCPYGLCDYSLASSIVWNCADFPLFRSLKDGILTLMGTGSDGDGNKGGTELFRYIYMPLTEDGSLISPEKLSEILRTYSACEVIRVPEIWVEKYRESAADIFEINEEEGFSDYIYRTKDLSSLAGHKYSKKRNLISQFRKLTVASHNVTVEPLNNCNAHECMEFLGTLPEDEDTGYNLELLRSEKNAIATALKDFNELEMSGVLVKIDGKTEAFAIGSRLNSNTFALNFEKANAGIKGLYQFLDENFAKTLEGRFEYINKENDLKKPGLIQAKESYHPLKKIKSYQLRPKKIFSSNTVFSAGTAQEKHTVDTAGAC